MKRRTNEPRPLPTTIKQPAVKLAEVDRDKLTLVAAGSGSVHVKWYDKSGWN
jgi:hypothetical protein